ncbi:MAG: hypothetical protein QOC78_1524 [Solirubrobacteraceae bacterium]|jgi:hypothetical protein|nr:hypothetical protein [Solirubrobacteraceae bacterium]MEA2393787.1 hypothetical protein [Solirubrobacteraceae bacterium]
MTAERVRARAVGTSTELAAAGRAGERSAAVAGREEWLHWLDHRESIHPEADGEWAPRARPRAARAMSEPRK